jgi:RNA polymerase sigma factor (sigma-70 family)
MACLSHAQQDDLILKWRFLPIRVVTRIFGRRTVLHGLRFDDALSQGLLGLVMAARRYDPDRGNFGGYAEPWIRGTVLKAVGENVVRIPLSVRNRRLERYGLDGLPLCFQWPSDLDIVADDDDETGHPAAPYVLKALATLPPRQRQILADRYLDDQPCAQVAARLGISRQAVQKTQTQGLERLRNLLQPALAL